MFSVVNVLRRPWWAIYHLPATGRSPGRPKPLMYLSTLAPFHSPLPFISKNHSPVLGLNTPILLTPLPSQSPTTGRSLDRPNGSMHISMLQSSSHRPLPFKSRNH